MTGKAPDIDIEEVRRLARRGGIELDAARAAPLVKPLASLLALDRRLAAMGMETRPIAGDPWGGEPGNG